MRPLILTLLLAAPLGGAETLSPEPREIRGGEDAELSRFREVLELHVGNSQCTAVVVAPRWALTAAHCVEVPSHVSLPHPDIHVHRPDRRITRLVPHPDYNDGDAVRGSRNDIAFIEVDRPFGIEPAELATAEQFQLFVQHGAMIRVVGWGLVAEGQQAPTLQESSWPLSRCNAISAYLAPRDRCFEMTPFVHEIMNGDSGAPVYLQIGGRRRLIGIATATAGDKAVFMSADYFRRWIAAVIGLDPGPPPEDTPPPPAPPPAQTGMRQLEFTNRGTTSCRLSLTYFTGNRTTTTGRSVRPGGSVSIELTAPADLAGSVFFLCGDGR